MVLLNPNEQPWARIDFNTVVWWMNQNRSASAHWAHNEYPVLGHALNEIFLFVSKHNIERWWAYSPSFDQVKMDNLFSKMHFRSPWSYRDWRDVRTIRDFLEDPTTNNSNAHDPLADCHSQIELVVRYYNQQSKLEKCWELNGSEEARSF